MVRGVAHAGAKKILADSLEAVVAAIYLHAGLRAAFEACSNFRIGPGDSTSLDTSELRFSRVKLKEEFTVALHKLAITRNIFLHNRGSSVGELHLKREQRTGGKKLLAMPEMAFSDLYHLEVTIVELSET